MRCRSWHNILVSGEHDGLKVLGCAFECEDKTMAVHLVKLCSVMNEWK